MNLASSLLNKELLTAIAFFPHMNISQCARERGGDDNGQSIVSVLVSERARANKYVTGSTAIKVARG